MIYKQEIEVPIWGPGLYLGVGQVGLRAGFKGQHQYKLKYTEHDNDANNCKKI